MYKKQFSASIKLYKISGGCGNIIDNVLLGIYNTCKGAHFMLRNIGQKLKIVSGVMFIISVIGSVISSVCSISNRRGFSLVLTLVSLFFSYIICFVIYVFGYLYDYLAETSSTFYNIASANRNSFPDISKENEEQEEIDVSLFYK